MHMQQCLAGEEAGSLCLAGCILAGCLASCTQQVLQLLSTAARSARLTRGCLVLPDSPSWLGTPPIADGRLVTAAQQPPSDHGGMNV